MANQERKAAGPEVIAGLALPGVAGRKTFRTIQVLRGVAAVMVVWHHTTLMQNERLSRARVPWLAGASGVDLFFVISGFVMALSAGDLRDSRHPVRTFLVRRLERVVPLYWLATTLKLALAGLLLPQAVGGAWHIVASYLFLPAVNGSGALHPVLIVGWTLNEEMFFYALVALVLSLRLPLTPALAVGLCVFGGVGILRVRGSIPPGPSALASLEPLLFEFLFGVLLSGLLPWLRARSGWQRAWCLLLLVGGFAGMVTHPLEVVRRDRALVWGLCAAAIVGSALALEEAWGGAMPRWLLAIGNASYSNYLAHTLLLAALGSLLVRFPALGYFGWTLQTAVCMAICTIAAQGMYLGLERPMMIFFQRQRSTDR